MLVHEVYSVLLSQQLLSDISTNIRAPYFLPRRRDGEDSPKASSALLLL